ncbi:MAG: ABC transporter permease [Bacteroidales bacterium]|nr:ABC transporter permease [Bacteroidales bacterium]
MTDIIQEIWSTIRKNKLRTFLTGFSVSWGIFLLIILLASGNGLQNGMTANFWHMSSNMVKIWPGTTSVPYHGYQKNRKIKLKTDDIEKIKIDHPEITLHGGEISTFRNVSYGKNFGSYTLIGVPADYMKIEKIKMLPGKGRFINDIDISEHRKVIVITPRAESILFRGNDPIGKLLNVDGVLYTVIGIYDNPGYNDSPPLYIPFTTAQKLYNPSNEINALTFNTEGLYTKQEHEAFTDRIRQKMGKRHQFEATDKNAIWVWDTSIDAIMIHQMFAGIKLFMWIVGLGTLIAGIVGVSNIMLITVRERTKEFGIRKAIGATPWSIIKLVIIESVIITAIFGYVGMLAGIGVSEIANHIIETSIQSADINSGGGVPFRNPDVPLNIVIISNIILIAAGILAGYIPARKAVNVTAIEAMHAD